MEPFNVHQLFLNFTKYRALYFYIRSIIHDIKQKS